MCVRFFDSTGLVQQCENGVNANVRTGGTCHETSVEIFGCTFLDGFDVLKLRLHSQQKHLKVNGSHFRKKSV